MTLAELDFLSQVLQGIFPSPEATQGLSPSKITGFPMHVSRLIGTAGRYISPTTPREWMPPRDPRPSAGSGLEMLHGAYGR